MSQEYWDGVARSAEVVDTWPDWKLDVSNLKSRERRRASGEILPKPDKDSIELAQRDATIAELRESHERLRKALEEMVANIGECTCHEGFTCRKLRDPECVFHRFDPEVANARAVLAAAPKEPETEKRPGAG